MRAVIQTLDLNGIGCEVFEDGSYELDDYGPSIVDLRPDQVDLLPHVAAYVARIAELETTIAAFLCKYDAMLEGVPPYELDASAWLDDHLAGEIIALRGLLEEVRDD